MLTSVHDSLLVFLSFFQHLRLLFVVLLIKIGLYHHQDFRQAFIRPRRVHTAASSSAEGPHVHKLCTCFNFVAMNLCTG